MAGTDGRWHALNRNVPSHLMVRHWGRRIIPLAAFAVLGCGEQPNEPAPGPATMIIVAGGSQRGTVGQPLDTALTVRVVDRRQNPVSDVEVQFRAGPGAGQVTPPVDTTDANGIARTSWTLGAGANLAYEASAFVEGLDTAVVFRATAAPGPPAKLLLITGDSQSAVINAALDSDVVVRVEDQYGNPVPSVALAFTITAGGSRVAPAVSVSDSQGLSRATWTMGLDLGYDSLTATVDGLPALAIGAETHPLPPVDSVGLGQTHTCRIDGTGQTYCWGLNFRGEVGSGDTLSAFTPRVLTGAPRFKSITAGGYHTCGLTVQSELYCWGFSRFQLGLAPTAQNFSQTFSSVSGGQDFTCGIDQQQRAYCWGENSVGQLGSGAPTPSATPVALVGGLRFRQVGAGYQHACGLTTNGRAHCWGTGPLGTSGSDQPVLGSLRFISLAVGWFANCGLTLSGEAWCWDTGQPVHVSSPVRFTRVAAGASSFCGLTASGAGYCWGVNDHGELGDGTALSSRVTPTPVLGGLSFASIHMGLTHSCGVTTSVELYCWGGGELVTLGLGETMRRRTPTLVPGGLRFNSISAGNEYTCGIALDGAAYCWGMNRSGELGDGSFNVRTSPTPVAGGFVFAHLSAGNGTTCGVTASSTALCWGDNLYGELGGGTSAASMPSPSPVGGGLSFAEISVGSFHTCARTTTNAAYCWGANLFGQVGDGTRIDRATPTLVSGGYTWSQVAAGIGFSCGITTTTGGTCWGTPVGLGNGGTDAVEPDSVHVAVRLTRVASGNTNQFACGIGADQSAYCWGTGDRGQLGDGSTPSAVLIPVMVSGGYSFTQIGVGNAHTCGLVTGGVAYCWGYNYPGSLGDGTIVMRTTPTPVAGGLTFTQLTVGANHACALDTGGAAYCWGANYNGQLGLGFSDIFRAPVRIQ